MPTFPSVYEQLHGNDQIARSHFADDFWGKQPSKRWVEIELNGSAATFGPVTGIDEGYHIRTADTTFAQAAIDFDGIHHFDPVASYFEIVQRVVTTTTNEDIFAGLGSIRNYANTVASEFYSVNTSESGNIQFLTSDGLFQSGGNSTVANDLIPHHYRIQAFASKATMEIDGVLEVTRTIRLPTVALQPYVYCRSPSSGGFVETRLSYIEAANT